MRKLINLLETTTPTQTTDVIINSNIGNRLCEFFEWVRDAAGGGTGITITATTNGGDTTEFYIDGDGPDRIHLLKMRSVFDDMSYADDDFEINTVD